MSMSMSNNIFQGERIRLRGIEPEDWASFAQANLDSETARLGYWIPFPVSDAAERKWTEETALKKPENDQVQLAIEALGLNEMAGVINSHTCNRRDGTFSYGLIVFEPYRRQGFAREAILLLMRYFFRELRYQKCTAGVYSFNEASLRLHERLGFTQEGRLRRMKFTGGQFHDEVWFGMTAEEFEARYGEGF